IRFYLHKTGKYKSGILLQVTELRPSENVSTEILWSYNDHGDQWVREVIILPNITHRYFIHFEARKGLRYMSDIAIDDVSLSPECFGLNIPPEELNDYNYWNPMGGPDARRETHVDFKNKTYYEITTCNAKGRFGPTPSDCTKTYNATKVSIKVVHEPGLTEYKNGWYHMMHTILFDVSNYFFSFILTGASGGKGGSAVGSSRGAMVRTVVELRKGQEIFMLVGQEGTNSCVKSLGFQANSSCHSDKIIGTGIRGVLSMDINDTIAGGGGGLGLGRFSVDNVKQHGQAINMSRPPFTGRMYSAKSAGAGGGWSMYPGLLEAGHKQMMGSSLQAGGIGGKACYNSTDQRGDGGFGGGGGGCRYGGGGGGYSGGDAPSINTTNGEGGYSYLDPSKAVPNLSEAHSGYNAGPGYVLIIPAIDGCECDYRCIALDAKRSEVTCICPKSWRLGEDMKTCIHNRYQQRATGIMSRKILSGADLQLDRLRIASDSMMTEYNPNYEFGGVVYTLKDLKDIPREQLRLVVPTSSDYLIPNHTTPTTPDQIESTSSVEKLLPDNSDNWETSFIMPHSRSTQPLLMDNNKEDDGATSVDKLLAIDNSKPNQKISPVSLPNNVLNHCNHNNNLKSECTLKSGVSLDAAALAKQAMTPSQNKKYANINTGDSITSNGILQNDPFSNHVGNNQKYLNEAEINC
ncbi:hypothetical protein NQ314_015507, partial [Rhamnusium bicolor]